VIWNLSANKITLHARLLHAGVEFDLKIAPIKQAKKDRFRDQMLDK
jgi:hypothetical protein